MLKFPGIVPKDIRPKRASSAQRFCCHKKLLADEATRMLECEACGMIIEPFDFLWHWANGQQAVEYRVGELRKQERGLYEKIVELKKEEKRIKARLRGAAQKKELDELKGE